METKTRLTLADLERALEDDRHNGWGYATSRSGWLSPTAMARLDCRVIDTANQLGLDYEELFQWTDSKYGRHLVDTIGGVRDVTFAAVRPYLNENAMQVLREGR